ncbi:hypothetical protein FACS1894132_14600 [Clostridia bacterium]|nr:hypothetical protein FACS1894132_14600 [Clostridia bacterium]
MNNAVQRKYDSRHYIIEKIDGKIVAFARPGRWHTTLTLRIASVFERFLKGKICKTYFETDVQLDENTTVVPDVIVVCDPNKKSNDGKKIIGAPDLIVEILSPTTLRHDKTIKKDLYEKYGVKELWLVSPLDEFIDVFLLDNNGKYYLNDSYGYYELDDTLDADEIANHTPYFTTSLYGDDLKIELKELFEGLKDY